MAKTAAEVFRDFVRYTGDGLPGEPVGHPLPVGDPLSGVHNPSKAAIREVIGDASASRIGAEAAASLAQAAMVDVQGATLFAADVPALLANSATSYPAGTVFATRKERVSYEVVSTDHDLTTAGGVKLRLLPGQRGYDIRGLGGADDWNGTTGTNNHAALERLAARAKPAVIHLPKAGTGVYMVNGTTAQTDLTGLTLDPDPGVSIYNANGIPITNIKGIASLRDLRTSFANLSYQRTLGVKARQRVTDLGRPGSALDGQLQAPERVALTDATHWGLSSWPNGGFATATPTAATADKITWGTPPAAGFRASVLDVLPGDFIQAMTADVIAAPHDDYTTFLPGIVVFTEQGWAMVRQSQSANQNTLIFAEKVGAANTVETSTTNTVTSQTTYRMSKSAVGIIIYDERSFGLVLNGTVIKRFRTSANITRAGWAGGFGTAGEFSISRAVRFRGKRTFGIKPLRIVALGDSTGDETVTQQSQYDYMRQHLAGIGGAQVEVILNLAKSGDKSAEQLTALQAANIAGYDYCLIQIGINDIQTFQPLGAFLSNIQTMVTHCRSAGVEPIVGIPAMFYSQADAQAFGQDGGPTNNSSIGQGHRLALMQTLADLGVYCNAMTFEDMGAVVASLLANKAADAWGDQVVYDNIHPTAWGTMLQGYGWAKAVAAHLTHARRDFPATIAVPSWFSGGTGAASTPRYKVKDSVIHWSWYLSTGGALADGTLVATLPPRLRPSADVIASAPSVTVALAPLSAATFLKIATNGEVRVYGAHASAINIAWACAWALA